MAEFPCLKRWSNSLAALLLIGLAVEPTTCQSLRGSATFSSQNAPPLVGARVWQNRSEALSTPVYVATMTGHYFSSYLREVPDCKYQGEPFRCIYTFNTRAKEADALWYHSPHLCSAGKQKLKKHHPNQLLVVMSMESAQYYTCLNDLGYMDSFDIEMTYRRCSHVPVTYFMGDAKYLQDKLFGDPVPFEEKIDAVAYVNSNCMAPSKRDEIVKAIMNDGRIPVHAWGACLRNKVPPHGRGNKFDIIRKYKFCIAMENSVSQDYITEKLWQAYEAGCVPIYYGTPNIDDYIPTPGSVLLWDDFQKNVTLLVDKLLSLAADKEAYMKAMAWKYMPLQALSNGFKKNLATSGEEVPHTQCSLCRLLMEQRLAPRNYTGTHCLRNSTFLAAQGRQATTWGPGSDHLLELASKRKWGQGIWDPTKWAPLGASRTPPSPARSSSSRMNIGGRSLHQNSAEESLLTLLDDRLMYQRCSDD